MRFTLPAACVVAAIAFAPSAAHAQAPPPKAWECSATVTGVQVTHRTLPSLATTAAVQEVTATVVCKPDGLLTTAPEHYSSLYAGGISLHVHSSRGDNKKCGDSIVPFYSAGPTLVMTATAICTWDPNTAPITYWPVAYWSTSDLDFTTNLTIAEQAGTFLN